MRNDTLCWYCRNAYKKCNWSRKFKPIKGWVAEETLIPNYFNGKKYFTKSFIIKKCPYFIRDCKKSKTIKEIAGELGISERTYYRRISAIKNKKV